MLTPQEAESHVFPKASFGGYNMLQVDAFLDSLIEDYRTLYQENASLKSKMKVLVEKVEEYRATEDAMRMTLHSAQKMADAMVKEGEAKKQAAIDQIAASVEEKSKAVRAEMAKEEQAVLAKLEQVKKDLANEQARLNAARASTTTYIGQLKDLYTAQIKSAAFPASTPTAASPPPRPRTRWSPCPRSSRKRSPRTLRPPWPRSSTPPPSSPPPPHPRVTWATPASLTR